MRRALLAAALLAATPAAGDELLYVTEGNRLRVVDLIEFDAGRPAVQTLVESVAGGDGSDVAPGDRRNVNGQICFFPDASGRFVVGEDTGQPDTPPGWGVFSAEGRQIGKLTATYRVRPGDPYGCAFDSEGRLFTSEIGNVGFGPSRGQLIAWFPPYDRYPGPPGRYPDTAETTHGFCKVATDIGNAGAVAVDERGRVYVASSGRAAIYRFSEPLPTDPDASGGCGAVDELGSPRADAPNREVFFRGAYTLSGLAFAPSGNLYASSVLTGEIVEIDPYGRLVRKVLDPPGLVPPFATGTPMGLAVSADGTLYYTDLDLVWRLPSLKPGVNGTVRRIRFDAEGEPLPPELVLQGLEFPDGIAVRTTVRPERPRAVALRR